MQQIKVFASKTLRKEIYFHGNFENLYSIVLTSRPRSR